MGAIKTTVFLLAASLLVTSAMAAAPAEAPVWRIDHARAKYTVEIHGYYAVTDLAQDASGVWRGRAWQYSRQSQIQVDQSGNFDVIIEPRDDEKAVSAPP